MPANEIPAVTTVILDGLADAQLGRQLSLAWAKAGIVNRVDVSGQRAELAAGVDIEQAAATARWFGLEIRVAPREKVVYEYKSRFATALVFGVPLAVLHYLTPVLATGSTFYPRVIELILAGWMCISVGWPVLYQGALSVRGLRLTPDLFTGLIVIAAMATGQFHAAGYALTLAVLQRWLAHRYAERIAGRADMVMAHWARLAALWLLSAALLRNVGFALLLPPLMGLGGVNRASPGASAALPVVAFAAVMVLGPGALGMSMGGMEIEVGAGFQLMMIAVMGVGWARMKQL